MLVWGIWGSTLGRTIVTTLNPCSEPDVRPTALLGHPALRHFGTKYLAGRSEPPGAGSTTDQLAHAIVRRGRGYTTILVFMVL